jgi:hypothetical protein
MTSKIGRGMARGWCCNDALCRSAARRCLAFVGGAKHFVGYIVSSGTLRLSSFLLVVVYCAYDYLP